MPWFELETHVDIVEKMRGSGSLLIQVFCEFYPNVSISNW